MGDGTRPRPLVLGVLFCAGLMAILLAPLAFGLLRIQEQPVDELRALAPWPVWQKLPVARWPGAFETWLNDHYPFRSRIVRWNAILQHRWFGQPSSTVIVGRNDWLYYVGDNTIQDLLGRDRYSAEELKAWLAGLEGRAAWWRARGAKYMLVIAPNKTTACPENLPFLLRARLRPGKLDQLLDYLREQHCTESVLDLRPALSAAKDKGSVYWETDSHWNGRGLLAACDAIMAKARELGAPTGAEDYHSMLRIENIAREGDCVGLLRLPGGWPSAPAAVLTLQYPADFRVSQTGLEQTGVPLAFERPSGSGRTVMLCDSFFRLGGLPNGMDGRTPLVLPFQRFVSIWSWHGRDNLAPYERCLEVANVEQPTLVIEEWTERYLRTPPPDHPEFAQARAAMHAALAHRN